MMRVRLTGRYRVLWGTRYWNPYPTLTIDPNSHPNYKTNQPTKQPTNTIINTKNLNQFFFQCEHYISYTEGMYVQQAG